MQRKINRKRIQDAFAMITGNTPIEELVAERVQIHRNRWVQRVHARMETLERWQQKWESLDNNNAK